MENQNHVDSASNGDDPSALTTSESGPMVNGLNGGDGGRSSDAVTNGSSGEDASPPGNGEALADSESPFDDDDDEDDDEEEGEGEDWENTRLQCEVCMAESWWRMAALQHQYAKREKERGVDNSSSSSSSEDKAPLPELDLINMAALVMFYSPSGKDLNMTKLRELYEAQKQPEGLPDFPNDFDEFWLLVVKARLFNIFRQKGPAVYNRIVMKIRDTVRKFMAKMEERERKEALEKESGHRGDAGGGSEEAVGK